MKVVEDVGVAELSRKVCLRLFETYCMRGVIFRTPRQLYINEKHQRHQGHFMTPRVSVLEKSLVFCSGKRLLALE